MTRRPRAGQSGARGRRPRAGAVILEPVHREALATIIPAFPIPERTDVRALDVGRREDGTLWQIRLHGSHVLLAGSTGTGKAPILWAIIRALLPALRDGTAAFSPQIPS